jgi:mono/diheme cytochrome c family protein
MLGRRLLLALAAAALVGIGGLIGIAASGGNSTNTPAPAAAPTTVAAVDPHVAAGAHDFVQFACAQCHGDRGRGHVSSDVPPLIGVANQLTPATLRSIIDHGLGESSNPTKPYMPVWGGVISATQVNDLIAYLRAGLPTVPTAQPPAVPTKQGDAVEGSVLYSAYGCINCHGPNGLGGVPNPQAPDRTIPPLSGPDFRKEFNTDAKIIDVIRSGSVIGRAPIVSMPHWGGIIPDARLRALVAYLKTLQ